MGETLGIAHNVFEKVAREKDRKERLKKFEDWQKEKAAKEQKIKRIRDNLKEKNQNGSLANIFATEEDLDDTYPEEFADLAAIEADQERSEKSEKSDEIPNSTSAELTTTVTTSTIPKTVTASEQQQQQPHNSVSNPQLKSAKQSEADLKEKLVRTQSNLTAKFDAAKIDNNSSSKPEVNIDSESRGCGCSCAIL